MSGAYRTEGYVVLRQVLDAEELAALRAECDRLAEDVVTVALALRGPHPRLHARRGGDDVVLQKVSPVADASPPLAALAADPRLLAALHPLLDDEPALIEEKLVYKQLLPGAPAIHTDAGAAAYPLHTDWDYYRAEGYPRDTLSVGIAFDDAGPANGCLRVLPGSHVVDWPVRTDGPPDVRSDAIDPDRVVDVPLAAGDAVVFASALVHESRENATRSPRRMLILSYGPAGRVGDPDRRNAGYRRAARDHEDRYRVLVAGGRPSAPYRIGTTADAGSPQSEVGSCG